MAVTRSLITAAILHLAALWKLLQLARAPRDLTLRAIALCVTCTAATITLGLDTWAGLVDHLTGLGSARLVQNVLLLAAVYWLMCVYLFSAEERQTASRRARWEALPLALAIAVLVTTTLTTPDNIRGRGFATADMTRTPVAVFYVTALLYLVYAFAAALRWTWRYARISLRPLATGLWLTAGALTALVAANVGRIAIDVTRWRGAHVPGWLNSGSHVLLALAIPLFVVGVSYSSVAMRVASARIWLQHRRAYQRMRPLWEALHDAFPQHALNRVPTSGWRDRLFLRGTHYRYYRRALECRDGLVHLSPYLAQLGVPQDAPPEVLAGHLRSALRTQAVDEAEPARAVAVAQPGEDSLDADVRQLVLLSQALNSQPIAHHNHPPR
ncbi:MAB_1171c family putative transporter [Streptomyces sp. CY1]|uniref:MAB_1171c family putative transporter n=1 Tax=Streptomyces sp. CY1 TaxID=3388313 RepID=UPI0039A04F34